MKKLLAVLIACLSIPAFARHHFTVCYYNWTDHQIKYENDVMDPKGNWKDRGQLVGQGDVDPNMNKCFTNIVDETMFFKHSIMFSIDGKFYGIVNAAFSRPYVITNKPGATGKGRLTRQVIGGKEDYFLNVHVTPSGVILSESADPKDSSQIIDPRSSK